MADGWHVSATWPVYETPLRGGFEARTCSTADRIIDWVLCSKECEAFASHSCRRTIFIFFNDLARRGQTWQKLLQRRKH